MLASLAFIRASQARTAEAIDLYRRAHALHLACAGGKRAALDLALIIAGLQRSAGAAPPRTPASPRREVRAPVADVPPSPPAAGPPAAETPPTTQRAARR